MKKIKLLLFLPLLAVQACTPTTFEGRKICYDTGKYWSTETVGFTDFFVWETDRHKFDDKGGYGKDGIINVFQRLSLGDPLPVLFQKKWGAPIKTDSEIVNFGLQKLSPKDTESYKYHSHYSDVFAKSGRWSEKGEFKDAKYVPQRNGTVNVYYFGEDDSAWYVFKRIKTKESDKFYMTDLLGSCSDPTTGTKDSCTFFDIYEENILLDISVPRGYVLHRDEIVKDVKSFLDNEFFCKPGK